MNNINENVPTFLNMYKKKIKILIKIKYHQSRILHF